MESRNPRLLAEGSSRLATALSGVAAGSRIPEARFVLLLGASAVEAAPAPARRSVHIHPSAFAVVCRKGRRAGQKTGAFFVSDSTQKKRSRNNQPHNKQAFDAPVHHALLASLRIVQSSSEKGEQ